MTQDQRDELLLSMKKQMDSMQDDNIKRDELLLSMKEQIGSIQGQIDSMQGQIDSMQGQINDLQNKTDKISESVAVIEHEHGGNIQLLLDGQVSILEKLDLFEERFKSNEEKLDNHSDRIWRLEAKTGII